MVYRDKGDLPRSDLGYTLDGAKVYSSIHLIYAVNQPSIILE